MAHTAPADAATAHARRRRRRLTRPAALAAAALAALGAAGCTYASETLGAGGGAGGATTGGAVIGADGPQIVGAVTPGQAASLVPADVKAKGTLIAASDASYAPFEYFAPDGSTVVGFDADLAKALAAKMGLRSRTVNTGFDTILAGLGSGKHDLGMSAFSVTPDRAKSVDFVVYVRGGTALAVPTGNPKQLTLEPTSLCGRTVSGQKGSVQGLETLPQFSRTCTAAGRPAITIALYPSQQEANLALTSGRADAILSDSSSLAYQASQSGGKFELAPGPDFEPSDVGVAIKKGSPLTPAVSAAMKELGADGTLERLVRTWQLPTTLLTKDAGKVVTS